MNSARVGALFAGLGICCVLPCTQPDPSTVNGEWRGTESNVGTRFEFQLEETASGIRGEGVWTYGPVGGAIDITGAREGRDVTLEIEYGPSSSEIFEGILDENTMTGRIGPGLVTFMRQ